MWCLVYLTILQSMWVRGLINCKNQESLAKDSITFNYFHSKTFELHLKSCDPTISHRKPVPQMVSIAAPRCILFQVDLSSHLTFANASFNSPFSGSCTSLFALSATLSAYLLQKGRKKEICVAQLELWPLVPIYSSTSLQPPHPMAIWPQN